MTDTTTKTTKPTTNFIMPISSVIELIKADLFTDDEIIYELNLIDERHKKTLGIIEDMCRNMISDSIKVMEHGFEFDDDSWESNLDNAKKLLTAFGFDAKKIYNEIFVDVNEEINGEDEDEEDDDDEKALALGAQLQEGG